MAHHSNEPTDLILDSGSDPNIGDFVGGFLTVPLK